jgi:glycosyltransferase involved in cell wall biosynthesis
LKLVLRNKIKILYISHSPYLNGAEICLYKLIRDINKDIFEPIVLFPENGPLVKNISSLGVKTLIAPMERWIRFKYDNQIRNSDMFTRSQIIADIIEKEKINIVHTNTSVVLEGAVAAKLKGIPHVWHVHEFLNGHTDLVPVIPLSIVYKIMSYLSDKIIAVSNYTKSQFEPLEDFDKYVVLYNGIEENNSKIINNIFKNKHDLDDNELNVVTIGLLTEAKGYDNLLETANIIRNKGYGIKFYWIGEALKDSLRKFDSKIKKLRLKNSVIYIGFKSNIPEIIRNSDLLISFSLNEALPTVILEAMAAEKAVIATDCGGTSECLINGETGYLVPVNNPDAMSNKIIELVNDIQKRKAFGENGLKRFKENFTSSIYFDKIEKLYLNLVENKSAKNICGKDELLIKSLSQMYDLLSDYMWKNNK